ncbi:MAG: hypothetical protein P4N59_23960 [Negativicutes bacterium]|nr:hypothetical protein [Negativicutes bacterium]
METTGPGAKPIAMEDYKPYSSRVRSYEVVTVAPAEADTMEQLDDDKFWDFLNNWEPKVEFPKDGNSVREDLHPLAGKFADLVVRKPERFTPASQWWKRATRPLMLYRVLERASAHFVQKQHDEKNAIPAPSEHDWDNWFGIIGWILERKTASAARTASSTENQPDWGYGWSSISRLLRMIIRSNYAIPESRLGPLRAVLEYLFEEDSEEWDGHTRSGMNDWYATAINSDRGNAVEALVYLGLRQKNEGRAVETWIFDLIKHCLERPKESPATFSLLGVHLGQTAYAFGENFKRCSDLLFPSDRPIHCKAAVISHFRYSQPHKLILDTVPKLPETALDILKSETAAMQDSNEKQEWRDFGSRFGVHLAFYFWTGAFASNQTAQKFQDAFFASASKSARKGLIHHIGQAFRNADESLEKNILKRTMQIWERRVGKIKSALKSGHQPRDDFDGELSEFQDWLDCECFPLDWRLSNAEEAIRLISKSPQPYGLIRTIVRFGQKPELLAAGIKLFHAILAKPGDELRWSVNYKELGPVLSSGLKSNVEAVRRCSKECLDRVLLLGCSDFAQLASDEHSGLD